MKCSFAIACASILLAASAFADARTDLLKHVGIDQNIGAVVPADIVFRDETGRTVRLGDYYGKRPIILSLVYHGCPMLCSTVLSELGVSLNVMPPSAGEEFDILTISFDARDTPEIAARKKDEYLRHYQRPHAAEGWHFLTGDQASIDRLTQAVGFRYLADPQFAGQFIHAGGILVLTPSGKISRYFYGINYAPKDLRLALIEAGEEKSGSLSDAVLLFCFGSSRNLLNLSVNAQSVGVQALYPKSIIATFHGIWSVAGFAAAGLGAWLIRQNVATAHHFLGVSVVLSGLVLVFFSGSLALPPSPPSGRPAFSWPEKTVLKYGLITFACMSCEGTFYDWSAVYFARVVVGPAAYATLGLTLYMVATTSGRFLGDWLVGRFGIKPILQASGVLMSTGLLLAAAFPTTLVAGLGFVLGGLGVSCVVPLVFSLVGKADPLRAGAAIASVSTVSYFGFLLMPPLVGFVAKAASLRWSFAMVALLGGLIVWVVPKLHEEAQKA